MKDLLDSGVISKVQDGVKILAKGAERFKALNVSVNLEISDASKYAIDAIK
jgi:ribosomal protein L15